MKQTPFSKAALPLAVLASLSSPVIADNFTLEEVVVTAQKRAQSLNDVGISVNAFTDEQMKELGIGSAADMAQHTPGMTLTESSPTGVPVYTIRGMGFDDYSAASNATVGIYINEVNLPYPVMTSDLVFDVERVEVLKGAQGDLYGRNSTAGAINFITNKPESNFNAGVNLNYGRYDRTEVEGYVTGSLANALQGRLAVKHISQDAGIQKHLSTGEELGEIDTAAVRAMLNWDVADNLSLLLDLHSGRDDSDGWAQQAHGLVVGTFGFSGPLVPVDSRELAADDPRDAAWSTKPQKDHDVAGASLTVNWDINSAYSLTSITAFDRFERDDANDWDATSTQNTDIFNNTQIDSYSQELRLATEGDGYNWILGLYLSHDQVDEAYLGLVGESQSGLGLLDQVENRYTQETDTRALFVHAEFDLTDEWRLTLGGRYTYEDRGFESCTYDANGTAAFTYTVLIDLLDDFAINASAPPLTHSGGRLFTQGDCMTLHTGSYDPFGGDFDAVNTPFKDTLVTENLSGKVTVDYMPNSDWLIYGSVGTGFKSGGFNGAFVNETVQLTPYTEEETLAFELGFKATLLESTMQLNGTLFHYDYRDKQVLDVAETFFGPLTTTVNVPRSEISGAEVELHWRPLQGFDIKLGVAYLDTEVKEFSGTPILNNPTDPLTGEVDYGELGAELPQSAPWQYNGLLAYEFPVAEGLLLRAVTDFSYTDGYYTLMERNDAWKVEDYWLVNARLALASEEGSWEVALWSRNIEDKVYTPSAGMANEVLNRGAGAGNTYGLSVSYHWM